MTTTRCMVTSAIVAVIFALLVVGVRAVTGHRVMGALLRTNTYDTLFLTARSRDDVPEYVFERFRKFTKGFHIKFYNDDDALQSIKGFGDTVLNVFQSLTGAHRADLWRYCMLFKYGGVYTDIKTVFTRQLRSILDDRYSYTVLAQNPHAIHQGFLACKKNSPVMHDVMMNVLDDWKPTRRKYDHFLKQFYNVLRNYGTVNVGANDSGWYLWKEKEDATLGTVRDRYGFLPLTFRDVNDDVIMICRDPKYKGGNLWEDCTDLENTQKPVHQPLTRPGAR
jgi:hypothetical protein